MRSIALMGRAGAGKDTAAALLAERYGHVRVAFADPLRRMALAVDPIMYQCDVVGVGDMDGMEDVRLSDLVRAVGWDAAKRDYPEVRRFLQRLGSEGVRDTIGPNTWVDLAHRTVRAAWLTNKPVVLTDVRFPNEVAYAKRNYFLTVWIERPGVGDGAHASESAVGPRNADMVVVNDGTPVDLLCQLDRALLLQGP